MRGAWIEILFSNLIGMAGGSLPMRGAWIEIVQGRKKIQVRWVAPHAGSVD